MSYIGNTQQNQSFVPQVDFFSGNGVTTAFTLSRTPQSVYALEVVVANVVQNPSDAYTLSGNTITFTSAPPSGTNNIYVYYTSPNTQVVQPGQGTVGTNELANGGVTTAKLSSTTGTGAVALASLPSFTTTIGVGGATASASGSGITFPATQSTSSDANTLDDYEEGTFSPTLTFGGGSTGITGTQNGKYTKIGNCVYFSVTINLSNKGSSTGSAAINGLPFTSVSGYRCRANIGYYGNTGNNPRDGLIATSTTYITLLYGNELQNLTNSDFTNSTELYMSGFYFVS